MRWTDVPIHFIDFEGSRASGVLEYGVVTVQGGGIVATDTRLCRATGCIRSEDAAVHGLTERLLAHETLFSEEFERFAGYRERGPLAAHFSGTENALLKAVWPYPRRSPDFGRPGSQIVSWGPWVDTARLAAETVPGVGSLKLESLVATFGLQAELDRLAALHCPPARRVFHAALYDALAGALLLLGLLGQANTSGTTLSRLLQQSVADGRKRQSLEQDTFL